jgi:hypothetical protein
MAVIFASRDREYAVGYSLYNQYDPNAYGFPGDLIWYSNSLERTPREARKWPGIVLRGCSARNYYAEGQTAIDWVIKDSLPTTDVYEIK